MDNIESNMRHWLSVHQQARNRIQRLIMLIAFIAVIAVVYGFKRIESLNETYQFAREFTLQLQKTLPRKEVSDLFIQRLGDISHGRQERIFVRLEEIPEIGWEYERFLSRNQPSGIFKVGGYELGYASFSLFLLLPPLGLFILIYLKLRTTAKIAGMLREKAVEYSEVQQRLNSIFSERATKRLGEHRWFYATAWTLVILLLVSIPLIIYGSVLTTTVTNTNVEINLAGFIAPLNNVDLSERTCQVSPDDEVLAYIGILLLVNISFGVLVWILVVNQLRSKKEPKKR